MRKEIGLQLNTSQSRNNTANIPYRWVYLIAIFTSLLISLWASQRSSIINPDAICYLLSAEKISTASLTDAMQLCGQARWPFYSFLIAALAHLTHFSYEVSAYLLNALFSVISVVTFMMIVRELGGRQRTFWLGAIVILLAHDFNGVREYIIRDHGFWAFYLVSFFYLLKFCRKPRPVYAYIFSASMMLATLFRLEGAIFLLLAPFIIWFQFRFTVSQRAKHFLILYLPTLALCVIGGGWMFLHPQQSLVQWGRISELTNQIQNGLAIIIHRYAVTKVQLAQVVSLGSNLQNAGLILITTWTNCYLMNAINALSLIYTILILYAWRNRTIILRSSAIPVLWGFIIINLLITGGFYVENLFLSKRYLIALALVLMLWVPFALNDIMHKWPSARHRITFPFIIVFILFMSLGGVFDFGYSKHYIRKAGSWLETNVPLTASVYSNDIQLMYYSKHFGDSIFTKKQEYSLVNPNQWQQYDYLALRLGKKDSDPIKSALQAAKILPVQVFKNRRGDKVAIYKVSKLGEQK